METWQKLKQVQPVATQILMNSLRHDRVSHAYLIQGMRGTGKKTLATLLAMTLFCLNKNGLEPCQTCHECKRIISKNHPDVYWVEPEGQSIKKEQIDDLVKEFSYTTFESNRKIYIISGSELLTINAANRILKFLEEPEIETTAILLTDNLNANIETIQSRCQILNLQPLDSNTLQKKLVNLQITENNARFLSALTNNIDEAVDFDHQGQIYKVKNIVLKLIEAIITKHEERFIILHQIWLDEIKGREEHDQALDILLIAIQDIVNKQVDEESKPVFFQENDVLFKQIVQHYHGTQLIKIVHNILNAKQRLMRNVNPTLVMEDLVLQL